MIKSNWIKAKEVKSNLEQMSEMVASQIKKQNERKYLYVLFDDNGYPNGWSGSSQKEELPDEKRLSTFDEMNNLIKNMTREEKKALLLDLMNKNL